MARYLWGAAFPAVVKEAKTVLFPIEEKKMRNNADGHVLVVSDYEPGADYVYYWGFAWDARTSRLLKPGTAIWRHLHRRCAIRWR